MPVEQVRHAVTSHLQTLVLWLVRPPVLQVEAVAAVPVLRQVVEQGIGTMKDSMIIGAHTNSHKEMLQEHTAGYVFL